MTNPASWYSNELLSARDWRISYTLFIILTQVRVLVYYVIPRLYRHDMGVPRRDNPSIMTPCFRAPTNLQGVCF